MIKRTMIAALLGLAVTSHAVLAQDMVSPANPGPGRTLKQPLSDEQKRTEQKVDQNRKGLSPSYHNDDSPSYPFNP